MAENTEQEMNEGTPIEGEAPTNLQAKTVEYTDAEKRAMAQGWVPKDQYEGTGKWRDAEEFLDRGELFNKIDEQNRRLKAAELTTKELAKHLEMVRKTEFNKALKALKAEKLAALEEGNAVKVVQLDDQIDEAKEAFRAAEAQPVVPQVDNTPNPQFVAWVNRNSWYNSNKAMQAYANAVADEIVLAGENNPTKVLEEVEKRVKKEFAHKFHNPNREKAGAVDGAGGKGTNINESFKLTDDERRVMQKFVKAGVMTEKEYIAEIKASRGE